MPFVNDPPLRFDPMILNASQSASTSHVMNVFDDCTQGCLPRFRVVNDNRISRFVYWIYYDEKTECLAALLDKARCYAYGKLDIEHDFDMLRSGDLHSLLKLLSSNGKIYWSQVQSDDTGRMKDFFPLRLFYQLPLYSDENGAYVLCADASCYLREYSYMRSMYSMLLYLFMDCILSRHFCKTETVVLSKGELRQFVEYFAQSITITHVLTVSHFSFFHFRASSCNSTTHTWSTVFSSFSQMSMPPHSLYSLSFIY